MDDIAQMLEELATDLVKWSEAYPEKVFPEPDPQIVQEVCQTLGITFDSISAMVVRQFTKPWGDKGRAALDRLAQAKPPESAIELAKKIFSGPAPASCGPLGVWLHQVAALIEQYAQARIAEAHAQVDAAAESERMMSERLERLVKANKELQAQLAEAKALPMEMLIKLVAVGGYWRPGDPDIDERAMIANYGYTVKED